MSHSDCSLAVEEVKIEQEAGLPFELTLKVKTAKTVNPPAERRNFDVPPAAIIKGAVTVSF